MRVRRRSQVSHITVPQAQVLCAPSICYGTPFAAIPTIKYSAGQLCTLNPRMPRGGGWSRRRTSGPSPTLWTRLNGHQGARLAAPPREAGGGFEADTPSPW